jgi:hypothetical protein
MSQSLAEGTFRNINHRDQALFCTQEHDSKHFLSEKLHIGTGSQDRFRIIEDVRTSVLTFCDHGHGKGSHHRLCFALWQELTQLLKEARDKALMEPK